MNVRTEATAEISEPAARRTRAFDARLDRGRREAALRACPLRSWPGRGMAENELPAAVAPCPGVGDEGSPTPPSFECSHSGVARDNHIHYLRFVRQRRLLEPNLHPVVALSDTCSLRTARAGNTYSGAITCSTKRASRLLNAVTRFS